MSFDLVYIKTIFIACAIFLSIVTSIHMVNTFGAGAINAKRNEKVHDYFLNFLGILLGWSSAFYFIFCHKGVDLEIVDLILIFIAFIGITGYLHHIVINKGFKP